MSLKFESPLAWPEWMPATPRVNQQREQSFPKQISLAESINYLDHEVTDIRAGGVLSLDIDNPLVERLTKKVGSRTGAALKLRYQEVNYIIACDRWQTMEHNIYALHLALRNLRNIERWGIAPMPVLLKGFELGSLTGSSASELTEWMKVFGLGPTATLDDTVAIYHRRAKAYAQDDDALTRLNILMEEARTYFGSK